MREQFSIQFWLNIQNIWNLTLLTVKGGNLMTATNQKIRLQISEIFNYVAYQSSDIAKYAEPSGAETDI